MTIIKPLKIYSIKLKKEYLHLLHPSSCQPPPQPPPATPLHRHHHHQFNSSSSPSIQSSVINGSQVIPDRTMILEVQFQDGIKIRW
jgi:hypothetical protein